MLKNPLLLLLFSQGVLVLGLVGQVLSQTLVRFELVLVIAAALSVLLLATALVSHWIGNKSGVELYIMGRRDIMARLQDTELVLKDTRAELSALRLDVLAERTENATLKTLLETFKQQVGLLQLELDDCRDKSPDN